MILAAQDGEQSGLRSAIMVAKVEDSYFLVEILGLYLNTAVFERGTVGVEAAAQAHFGKPASRLSARERVSARG